MIAAAGLARDDGRPPVDEEQLPLLGSLLDQLALALERARLESEARQFAETPRENPVRSEIVNDITRLSFLADSLFKSKNSQ